MENDTDSSKVSNMLPFLSSWILEMHTDWSLVTHKHEVDSPLKNNSMVFVLDD